MDLERLFELAFAFLGGGSLTAIVSLSRARAQNNLDQAQAWKTLMEQMQSRMLHMQVEIDDLKIEIVEKDGYIGKLIQMLNKSNMEVPTFTVRHRIKNKE